MFYQHKITTMSLAVAATLAINGCGGGGGSSSSDPVNTTLTKGYLVDAPIAGVTYTCGDITGVTTETGEFECATPPVSFRIGSWEIGSISSFTADNTVFPQDLLGLDRNNTTDPKLKMMARVLQTMDSDGNTSNGIQVADTTKNLFTKEQYDLNGTVDEFETLLGRTLISEEAAIEHLRAEIEAHKTEQSGEISGGTGGGTAGETGGETGEGTGGGTTGGTGGETGESTGGGTTVIGIGNGGDVETAISISSKEYDSISRMNGVDITDKIASLYSGLSQQNKSNFFPPVSSFTPRYSTVSTGSGKTFSLSLVAGTSVDDYFSNVLTIHKGDDNKALTEDDQITQMQVRKSISGSSSVNLSFYGAGSDREWFSSDDEVSQVYGYGGDGSVFTYTDSDGYRIDVMGPLNTGDDNVLFGADDTPYAYAVTAVFEDKAATTVFNGSGSDGLWFTADDEVREHSVSTLDANGHTVASIVYNDKGADGKWYTSDDGVLSYLSTILSDNKVDRIGTFGAGDDSTWFTGDDVLVSQVVFIYDVNGHQRLVATHVSKGSDNTWFTSDDTASAVSYVHTVSGQKLEITTHTSIGADGLWITGDDGILSRYLYREDGTQLFYYNSAGTDGIWFTEDDEGYGTIKVVLDDQNRTIYRKTHNSYFINKYDEKGRSVGYVNVSDYGQDNLPETADDIASYGVRYEYANETDFYKYSKFYRFKSPGIDGEWFTEDDEYTGVTNNIYDDAGNLIKMIQYNDRGTDDKWGTDDDVIASLSTTKFDAHNRHTTSWTYSGSGADNNWSTEADNVIGSGYEYEYNSDGNVTKITYYGQDKNITLHTYSESDENGRIILEIQYRGAGDDGIWKTEDDKITYLAKTTYDESGNYKYYVTYGDAGDDGIWNTEDDTVSSETFYHLPDNYIQNISANTYEGRLLGDNEEAANIPLSIAGTYNLTFTEQATGSGIVDGVSTKFVVDTNGTLTIDDTIVLKDPVIYRDNAHEAIWFDTNNNLQYALSSLTDGFREINVGSDVHYDHYAYTYYGQYRDVNSSGN